MDIYSFSSYKIYLSEVTSPTLQRGLRSKLAHHLGCQSGYISQVIKGNSHFSLEHCLKTAHFLGLTDEERHYFMLMAQAEKAGTADLQTYYRKQMEHIQKQRRQIGRRLKVENEVSEADYVKYYGHWSYAAIHILVSIPQFQEVDAIRRKLGLERAQVVEALDFLRAKGLVVQEGEKYKIGKTRIHLDRSSALISKHHANWRVQALRAVEARKENDFFYSSVVSLSRKDYERFRDMTLAMLETMEPILHKSKEEEICCLNIDLFTL